MRAFTQTGNHDLVELHLWKKVTLSGKVIIILILNNFSKVNYLNSYSFSKVNYLNSYSFSKVNDLNSYIVFVKLIILTLCIPFFI